MEIKIMDRIMKTLFIQRKEMSAKELARESGLTLRQVTRAIHELIKRNMILKKKKDDGARGPKKPYIKIRDVQYIEKYLSGRRLL